MTIKKTLLTITAFLISFCIAEFITGYVIGYPKSNTLSKIYCGSDSVSWSAVLYKPFSEYWSVEGGNQVHRKNNLGLSGLNVDTSKLLIYLIGNSYVEAREINPEKIASTIFQQKLKANCDSLDVINIGYGLESPYDSFIHLGYYEQFKKPETVILLFTGPKDEWLKKHKKAFVHSTDSLKYKAKKSFSFKFKMFFRNNSSVLNLLQNWFDELRLEESPQLKYEAVQDGEFTNEFKEVLRIYKSKYADKFMLVSIASLTQINQDIKKFCTEENISFYYDDINKPENKIKGIGHLTEEGNLKLGNLIYNSYVNHKGLINK